MLLVAKLLLIEVTYFKDRPASIRSLLLAEDLFADMDYNKEGSVNFEKLAAFLLNLPDKFSIRDAEVLFSKFSDDEITVNLSMLKRVFPAREGLQRGIND